MRQEAVFYASTNERGSQKSPKTERDYGRAEERSSTPQLQEMLVETPGLLYTAFFKNLRSLVSEIKFRLVRVSVGVFNRAPGGKQTR